MSLRFRNGICHTCLPYPRSMAMLLQIALPSRASWVNVRDWSSTFRHLREPFHLPMLLSESYRLHEASDV
jgi:hypothetical protein